MAIVSIPIVATAKSSELPWWKPYDENTHPKASLMYAAFVTAPPKTSPELAREKALAYVSEARAAVGAKRLTKLPRGRVGNGHQCVLARALPCCVSVNTEMVQFRSETVAAKVAAAWATTALGSIVPMPEALGDFVRHFDSRHYEDLIA